MVHLGKNTKSRIISKGISAGKSNSTYRGLVTAHKKAKNARNFTQCDSLLIGDKCGAHTVPYIESDSPHLHNLNMKLQLVSYLKSSYFIVDNVVCLKKTLLLCLSTGFVGKFSRSYRWSLPLRRKSLLQ